MAENPITKLPLLGQVGVGVGAAVAILAGFYFLYYDGAQTEIAGKTKKLDTLRAEIRNLEVTAQRLAEFEREVAQLEQKLEILKRILPADKETADLMKKIQYLAAQANLSIKKFNPSPTVQKEFYQEWPIVIDVDGTYHNLGFFFEKVARLSRLVNVGNLKIKGRGAQATASRTIQATCTATTFVYVEAPAPAPKGGRPAPAKK